ncbi:insulin-like growth factor 1 receptor [Drosophila rhopaloa]|uniref:receptor protein-tyrosine kinase n=1 Tax=Drosophila rhopaloa TaxID=1041015 RepID=A0ABM5HE05_DRORH|nr:insulin-like growth factor 1 receptor [Drosophila rhopaloa]XP_016978961.2 insulin-like growth factor 1 receptor [Drosophila rhopaloa]
MQSSHMLLGVGLMLLALYVPCADSKLEHECTSIDIRNECKNMHLLDNCTVVTGYVMITLIPIEQHCNFSNYSFPLLTEITEFMIFTEVRGMANITDMFPNLAVIRGRRLFLNYALGVTSMYDLEQLAFPQLVAIQRGQVYIGNCPQLCNIDRVNWDLLTLSRGDNHIIAAGKNCSTPVCKGCTSSYCWSNIYCQRSLNENVVNPQANINTCHEECLGGCHGDSGSAADCAVCRGLSDAGVCVKSCPKNKYALEHFQRCYTKDECVTKHGFVISESQCVAFCPSGYKADNTSECVPCGIEEACVSVCTPDQAGYVFSIYSLADAEKLRGCQIFNGSMVITIRNKVNETQLAQSFQSMREIRGYLKIYRSSQLKSLDFLSTLERVHGDPLETRHYSFVLYDNKQLAGLWKPSPQLEFMEGGMFMHRNNKLCNRRMREFQNTASHDRSLDSLQTNDQEVQCSPLKMLLFVQKRTHRTVKLSWLKHQTSQRLELIHRPLQPGKLYHEESDLEAPVCTRINWKRRLLFPDDLIENGTHYLFELDDLEPSTRYACLLRTFGDELAQEARSELTYVQTEQDIPKPPVLELVKKTDSSLSMRMAGRDHDSFVLTVFELPDDRAYIDQRNYCRQPSYMWQAISGAEWLSFEDYDDCCAGKAEQLDDSRFIANMREQYRCSLDDRKQCRRLVLAEASLPQLRLAGNTTEYELKSLHRFRLYALQLQACNQLGCSSHTTLYGRTNYTMGADLLSQLNACHIPETQKYILRFEEPQKPNGMVTNYVIHYRNNFNQTHAGCVTRQEHKSAGYVYVKQLNITFNECAVQVHSLAGDVMTPYIPIKLCSDEEQRLLAHNREAKEVSPEMSEVPATTTHAHGISIFLVCFLSGCTASLVWVLYKRRCWRQLPGLRRYVPVREQWLRDRQQTEDREILVDGFETVRFQNNNDSQPNDYTM